MIPKGLKKRARTRTAQTQMVQPPTTASPRSPGGSARRQVDRSERGLLERITTTPGRIRSATGNGAAPAGARGTCTCASRQTNHLEAKRASPLKITRAAVVCLKRAINGCAMPARRDRSKTPAKKQVANESVDTFELGTSVTVFWTGEKAWYDGVIDGQRKEGGRRGPLSDPRTLSPFTCIISVHTHSTQTETLCAMCARGSLVHRVVYTDGDVKWHDLSAERVIVNGALSTDPRSTTPSKKRAASPSKTGGAKTPKASPAKPPKASPAKPASPAKTRASPARTPRASPAKAKAGTPAKQAAKTTPAKSPAKAPASERKSGRKRAAPEPEEHPPPEINLAEWQRNAQPPPGLFGWLLESVGLRKRARLA
jgi:hypothetical protein